MNENKRVLLALTLGVGVGTLTATTRNAQLLALAGNIYPVGTLWVNAIRMTVIPLVVSLLITGVASATDVKAIGRLGGRTLATFVMLLAGTAVVVMPFVPSVFALLPHDSVTRPPLPAGTAEAAGQL